MYLCLMSSKQSTSGNPKTPREFIFGPQNYLWMFIGLALIALGYILMSGGGSDDPNVFNPEIFSFQRIRLAPALVLAGLGLQVYAILRSPHKKK